MIIEEVLEVISEICCTPRGSRVPIRTSFGSSVWYMVVLKVIFGQIGDSCGPLGGYSRN